MNKNLNDSKHIRLLLVSISHEKVTYKRLCMKKCHIFATNYEYGNYSINQFYTIAQTPFWVQAYSISVFSNYD